MIALALLALAVGLSDATPSRTVYLPEAVDAVMAVRDGRDWQVVARDTPAGACVRIQPWLVELPWRVYACRGFQCTEMVLHDPAAPVPACGSQILAPGATP